MMHALMLTVLLADDFFDRPWNTKEEIDEPGQAVEVRGASKSRFGLAFKLGSYRPNIDGDPASNNWYASYFGKSAPAVFGEGRKLLMFGEGDIYFYRDFGLLGISGGAGYWVASSQSRICDSGACTPVTVGSGTAGNDKTAFSFVPISLSLVYKLTVFLDKWQVPLVPYVRAGLDCYVWWITGSEKLSTKKEWQGRNDVQGLGATFGWHVRPGLALDMGWADKQHGLRSIGVNNFAITFEWQINRIDDFWSPRSWDLSDNSFLAGVEVQFSL